MIHGSTQPTEDALPAQRSRAAGWPRRVRQLIMGAAVALVAWIAWVHLTYPSDRTPEGAYLRVMSAVNRGRAEAFFPYIETRAQHACYTIRDYRKKARGLVLADYPEPERSRLAELYREEAAAPDGSDVFALYARRRGWMDRLRKDLSGIARVERRGERATVETVRGTRYPLRIRPENGIWGLSLFTADLVSEAERAARDFRLIERASADYRRARGRERPP